MRASEARFQQFAAASAGALWMRSADTMAMESASPAVAAIYGIEAGALLGDLERWAAMIVPEDRGDALEHIEQHGAVRPSYISSAFSDLRTWRSVGSATSPFRSLTSWAGYSALAGSLRTRPNRSWPSNTRAYWLPSCSIGCAISWPSSARLAEQRPDAVLLDINFGPRPTFKLAEVLKDQAIHFVFVTGYDQDVIPAEFDGILRLEKPVYLRQIVSVVSKPVTPAT